MFLFTTAHLFVVIIQVHVSNREEEASSDLSAASLPFPTPYLLFPASSRGQRDPCLLALPSATGKLRRGELGRGRNRAPNYKVTRENQSLLELSWYWKPRAHQTADQWVSLGRRREGGGVQSRIFPKESVPRYVQVTPKVARDPVACSNVLVWMFTCLFWLYAHATATKDPVWD